MAQQVMTTEEIISMLKHTALPTILVEGRDDMTTYRWIEEDLGIFNANIVSCGGRDCLLKIYDNRREFPNLKTVFLADQDCWLFTKCPENYCDVILTSGYSIENDILNQSSVPALLSEIEKAEFDQIAKELSKWFAFEVENLMVGNDWNVDLHPNQLVPIGTSTLARTVISKIAYKKPSNKLIKHIYAEFNLKFRGKSLLQLYARILNNPRRKSKYSKENILEIGTKLKKSKYLLELVDKIRMELELDSLTESPLVHISRQSFA